MTPRKTPGTIIIPYGTLPEKHELEVATIFIASGVDVTFIVPNRRHGSKTPDIIMSELEWEIKVPKGSSSRTIENNFRSAIKQSPNIIFDLRRTSLPDSKCIKQLEKEFHPRPYAKRLSIITKQGVILTYSK